MSAGEKINLQVQVVPPRDWFDTCTLTVEQWLANTDSHSNYVSKTTQWLAIMEACALVLPGIHSEGLRQEPRIGFDPIRDQLYFIFKASNNGTTFIVSQQGLAFDEDELIPSFIRGDRSNLSPARCRLDVILVEPSPSKSDGKTANERLMAACDSDPIGYMSKDEHGTSYPERWNTYCPSCRDYVLIVGAQNLTDRIWARCLAGCAPEVLARKINESIREFERESTSPPDEPPSPPPVHRRRRS